VQPAKGHETENEGIKWYILAKGLKQKGMKAGGA